MTPLYFLSHVALLVSTFVSKNRAILQLVFGAIAFILGFWGFHLKSEAHGWPEYANNFFRTMQLITLHFPSDFDAKVPWQLQIARLLLPLVAVSATFHILVGGVTRPLRLAMLPRARDHVVLTGDQQLSEAALKALVADRR